MVGNRPVTSSDGDWSNPDNCKVDDTSVASATLNVNGDRTSGLAASNFDFSGIPDGVRIDGVEIRVGDYDVDGTGGSPVWTITRLILDDNTDGSENKFGDLTDPTTSLNTDEAGGVTDLWSEDLSRTIVQDVDFGFFISNNLQASVTTVFRVDFMQMRVFYTLLTNTGWKFPGTMVGNRTITGSDADWTNPDNCKADDGSVAEVTLAAFLDHSSGLAASNFDFSVIPSGATIDGVEVRFGDYVTNAAVTNEVDVVRLILADNTDGIENKGASGQAEISNWIESNLTDEAGGAIDLWGEVLTRTDVQDVDFGCFFNARRVVPGGTDFDVDFIQMRVFYHEGLPTTIVSVAGLAGHHPPFKSSGGAFYVVVLTTSSIIDVYKATDPADSWVQQDPTGHPIGQTNVSVISVAVDDDTLHIAWYTDASSGEYRYKNFNMADDTWDAAATELIDTATNNPTLPWISIAVRSDGDVVVAYAGDTDQVMGGKKERVDVNIRTSGTWGGPVALDAAGDNHYGNPNCVLGTNDFIHFVWQETNLTADPPAGWRDIEARTVDPSDNTLSTLVRNPDEASTSALLGVPNLVSYDDAGTQRIEWVFPQATINIRSQGSTEDVNDEIVAPDNTDEVTTLDPHINGEVFIGSLAVESTNLHLLFSGGGTAGVDQDLYYTKSTDDGATWDTETEEINAITINFISGNVYVRGADTVLAYVYDDGGVQKYNEKVLIAGAVDLIQPPLLHSFAVTRSTNY